MKSTPLVAFSEARRIFNLGSIDLSMNCKAIKLVTIFFRRLYIEGINTLWFRTIKQGSSFLSNKEKNITLTKEKSDCKFSLYIK